MIELPAPKDIEETARAAGKSMRAVCSEAGVAISTWTRWKSGRTSPRIDIAGRIVAAAYERPAREAVNG